MLMISMTALVSESRGFAGTWAALHAVTYSRRSCLTAVWSSSVECPGPGRRALQRGGETSSAQMVSAPYRQSLSPGRASNESNASL